MRGVQPASENRSPSVATETIEDTEISKISIAGAEDRSESRGGVYVVHPCTPLSFVERQLRLGWVELGERVARAMGMRQEFLTTTHRHWWAPCDVCGEPTLIAQERPCRMTPGCGGRHRKPQPQETPTDG